MTAPVTVADVLTRWIEDPSGAPDLELALEIADHYGAVMSDTSHFGWSDERNGMGLALVRLATEVRRFRYDDPPTSTDQPAAPEDTTT